MVETFVKMPATWPRIGLFDGPDTLGWNTPHHSQPFHYQPLIARHYSYRQIGQRETRPDIIEVVNIRVEVLPVCAGDWPHRKHEFAFCQSAFACVNPENAGIFSSADLRHANFIEHSVDGVVVKRTEYGHSSVCLYGGVECYLNRGRKNETSIDCNGYPAADMLWADTFCCGAKLVADRHFTDYSTLTLAHCEQCLRKWEVVDGLHFRSSLTVDRAHSRTVRQ